MSDDPEAKLTPKVAAQLLLMRRKARTSYADYLRYWIAATNQPFKWSWHFDFLADVMEAVYLRQEDLRFLNVNIPPRFAKSTLLSQQWQAWMLGRDPTARSSLFSISSSMNLAARDSRRTLDTVKSAWYQALFPDVVVGNKETESEWELTKGGYRLASGRDGLVTGRGAHHVLLDDLVSALEGDSEVVREDANEFLGRSLRSRLDDQITGTITNIQQRLHEHDATGYLQDLGKYQGGDQYKTIEIPNESKGRTIVALNGKVYKIREDRELLHPTYFDAKATAALKVAMRNNYEGQYQQNPIKMVGGHLDPRRILRLQGTALELKSSLGLNPVFYLDFAGTDKQINKNDPDYSVIHVLAEDQLHRLIHLDVWRKQTADYGVLARTLLNMHKLWRPRFVKGEKGVLLNLFQPVLAEQSRLMGYFINLEPLPNRGHRDKMERSMPYQGKVNAGMVCAPENAPWFADYEREMRSFPNGAHDDCHPAETRILTARGLVRIDEVTVKDRVLTRNGWRRVLRAWCKGYAKVVTRFGITATPDHPIWTESRGWVTLADLKEVDTVLTCVKSLLSTATGSPDTPRVIADICEYTFGTTEQTGSRPSPCIDISGRKRRVQSHRDIISTTEMATPSTTVSEILSVCRVRNIEPRIQWLLTNACSTISPPSDRSQHRRSQGLMLSKNTAPMPVSVVKNPSRMSVLSAVRRSSALASKSPANASASSLVTLAANESAVPVYNLTIEHDHEFVADGVLVSNCLEGGWDAAVDKMPVGEAPTISPTDPQVILNNEMVERINKARDVLLYPERGQDEDW